jgi:C4-type Zn-finger protein
VVKFSLKISLDVKRLRIYIDEILLFCYTLTIEKRQGDNKMIKCPNCGLSNPIELTDRDTPYKEEIVNEYFCEECDCWFSVTFKATEIKVLDK